MYAMVDVAKSDDIQSFFRSIPQDLYDATDGHVDSPQGWFGIVEINDQEYTEHAYPFGKIPDSVRDGLYLVVIDSNGSVWADVPMDQDGLPLYHYRHAVWSNFNELRTQYADWCEESDADGEF